jgi:hypothetical protein
MNPCTRRRFLATSSSALGLLARPGRAAAPQVSFFAVSDTHFRAREEAPEVMEPASVLHNQGLIAALNRLPGTPIPEAAGGGVVAAPAGVLHGGDLIDSGDKTGARHEAMQRTEWAAYEQAFGRGDGTDGALKWPVFEAIGNHDCPHRPNFVLERLAARQRARTELTALSANGLHTAWVWGGIPFIALGLTVGTDRTVARPRRYGAWESLDFLREVLAGLDRDQPVVVMHHIDIGRYAVEKPGADVTKWEWDPADVQAFHAALAGRRAALFHGHTHRREFLRWDGSSTQAASGLPVINIDNSAHFGSKAQAFFHVEVHADALVLREYATRDGWATGEWTPQVWRVPW